MPHLNIGRACITTDKEGGLLQMSRSAFTQQVGKKARAPHPSIAALQSIPSSQISSLRGPLLDATVAGYTNLKAEAYRTQQCWLLDGRVKDCIKHTISTISALYPIDYRRSPVQKQRRLKINIGMQSDNLEAMHTFVLVLSLEEIKRNTVPHKGQQRGRKHAAYALAPSKWSWYRFTLAA